MTNLVRFSVEEFCLHLLFDLPGLFSLILSTGRLLWLHFGSFLSRLLLILAKTSTTSLFLYFAHDDTALSLITNYSKYGSEKLAKMG